MTEHQAKEIMAEITGLWPKMPVTARLTARYIERLCKIHLDIERCMDVVHARFNEQRSESRHPRTDPPMETLIRRLREIELGDRSITPTPAAEPVEDDAITCPVRLEEWASELERGGGLGSFLARTLRRRAQSLSTHASADNHANDAPMAMKMPTASQTRTPRVGVARTA